MVRDYAHQQRGIIIALPSRRNKRVSAGLGAAYLHTWGRRAGLKFVPLGTRKARLLADYAALSRRDLLREQTSIAAVLHTGEKAILQVERQDELVKFRLCSPDTSVCEDLLGGRTFPLALIESRLAYLHEAQGTLQKEAKQQRTYMIGAAIVATAASAPVTLKNSVGRFSRTAKILASRWDGYDFNYVNKGVGNARAATRQKAWRPLQEFLQKIFDSRPVQVLGETASKTVEAWNGLFVKLGRERFIAKTLRTGIPAVIIVGSGVTVLLTSLKLAKQELTLEKVAAIKTQQEDIFKLLQNPYQEVLIHDRTVLLQSLHFLVNQR